MSTPNLTPLPPERQQIAEQLAAGLDHDQALWLSGYFAGLASATAPGSVTATAAASPAAKPALTVLYGTESGNSEELADQAKKLAEKEGFKVTVTNMADIAPKVLAKAERLLVIVSTWGEGDPPDAATDFHETFMGEDMVKLPGLPFSVCALGDTSYEHFCQIGRDVDKRLAELGAERVHDRADCDVEYQPVFDEWITKALKAFPRPEPAQVAAAPATAAVAAGGTALPAAAPPTVDKDHPYEAEILEKIVLNGTGSAKETLHVELSLENSGLAYEPGDSLAIHPVNRAADIDAVLAATGLRANAALGDKTLADSLRSDYDITTLSPALALKYNGVAGDKELEKLLAKDRKNELKEWIQGRQLVDLLEAYPHSGWTPESFTGILRKLAPRLYSIASSLKAHEDEVHLTIAAVRYHTHGRDRTGVCSCYVADDVGIGDKVRVHLHSNKNFRLPGSDDTPIIMVGPGTGIAPFRAFVEERSARGAKGENWLFFGDQKFSYDFLYQLEWLDHLKDGALTRLDTAFSRDQKEKIYVQHRLLEHGAEIWEWLESGASFYVCGDASRMAKDVHQALLDIVAEHGGKSEKEAKDYVTALRKEKRYQRDVY